MPTLSIFDSEALAKQVQLQKKHGWDLKEDFPWSESINLNKIFVPLDDKAFAFPGLSSEQRVVISQYMGLVVNETISEMENSLPRLKYKAWECLLDAYPVNPELYDLGELFFAEEEKHAKSFSIYLDKFCEQTSIDRATMSQLLPKGQGSIFQKSMIWNAEIGGHAFWRIVAAVEEISIEVYKAVHRYRDAVDPLFYILHKRHAEEEVRHENYAFMMLSLANYKPQTVRTKILSQVDALLSDVASAPWVLTELTKLFRVKKLKGEHPWFNVLNSCLPYFEKMSKVELAKEFLTQTPYISWIVHPGFRKKSVNFGIARSPLSRVLPDPEKIDFSKLHKA